MSKLIDCVDITIMTFLKHTIHVFVFIGCIGFAYVFRAIALDSNSGPLDRIDPYEIELARETNAVVGLMEYHPVAIGVNKSV